MGLVPAPRPFGPLPRKNEALSGRRRADLPCPKGKVVGFQTLTAEYYSTAGCPDLRRGVKGGSGASRAAQPGQGGFLGHTMRILPPYSTLSLC